MVGPKFGQDSNLLLMVNVLLIVLLPFEPFQYGVHIVHKALNVSKMPFPALFKLCLHVSQSSVLGEQRRQKHLISGHVHAVPALGVF